MTDTYFWLSSYCTTSTFSIAYIWHVPDDSLEKSSHLHGLETKNNYWTLATMEFGESITLGHIKILCLHLDQTAKRLKGNSNRPIFSFSYN